MFMFKSPFLLLSMFILSTSLGSIQARSASEIVPREYDDDDDNEIFDEEEMWKDKINADADTGKRDDNMEGEDDKDDDEEEEKKIEIDEEEKKIEDDEEEMKIEDDEEEKKFEDDQEEKKVEDEEEEKKIEDEEEEKKIKDEKRVYGNGGGIKFEDKDAKDQSGIIKAIIEERLRGEDANSTIEEGGKAKGYLAKFYEKLKNFFRKRFS